MNQIVRDCLRITPNIGRFNEEIGNKKRRLVGVACARSKTKGKPMMRCILID